MNRHLQARLRQCFSALLLSVLTTGIAGADAFPRLMDEQEEIAAALEGAPSHLREGAGVLVLKAKGYVSARESRNGFTCLLIREYAKSFEPTCYDAEGTATMLPVTLFRFEMLAKGMDSEAIQAAVTDGFFTGRFRAPRKPGLAYMLSPRNIVVLDRDQKKVGPADPHLMFFAPYATNADLGATPDLASHFVIADEGSPHALIIVPFPSSATKHEHE